MPDSMIQPNLPSPSNAALAVAWRGCAPEPGLPTGRIAFALAAITLSVTSLLALEGWPMVWCSASSAAIALWTLFGTFRKLCRVLPTHDGLDIVWRVSPDAFGPVQFIADRPRWTDVTSMEKVHQPDDGESGERWSVRIGVRQRLQDGKEQVELRFDDEARLDAWLGEALCRRGQAQDERVSL